MNAREEAFIEVLDLLEVLIEKANAKGFRSIEEELGYVEAIKHVLAGCISLMKEGETK